MKPTFVPGDRVRVRAIETSRHCRTPHYLRDRRGVVTRLLGVYPDPAKLAYHEVGLPCLPLYTVAFDYREVFGRDDPNVTITADLFQPWLARDEGR